MNLLFSGAPRVGLFLLLFVSYGASLQAQVVEHRPDPRQLFERMRLATMLYSYSGSLTYEHDGQLSSFEISSAMAENQWAQNIRALNGPERSFARQIDPCTLGSLDQLREKISRDVDKLTPYYNFQARGGFRIAGREAQEISVMPVDQFRYGYSFAVDIETGLMLQSMTMDSARKILERFQFIEIENPPSVEAFQELIDACLESPDAGESALEDVPWRTAWLPAGFERLVSRNNDGRVELVYGDGLAAVSIFIVPVDQVRFPPANTSTGATSLLLNYYDVLGNIYSVTLVGELPLATLNRIATGLDYAEVSDAR